MFFRNATCSICDKTRIKPGDNRIRLNVCDNEFHIIIEQLKETNHMLHMITNQVVTYNKQGLNKEAILKEVFKEVNGEKDREWLDAFEKLLIKDTKKNIAKKEK